MRSVRVDPELESRLLRAAAIRGESFSEFIRQAAVARADATLEATSTGDFDDVLGVVHGGGGQARRTGEAFADIVASRSSRS